MTLLFFPFSPAAAAYASQYSVDISSNEYFTRTPGSGGNKKTWTLSIWFKRTAINSNYALYGVNTTTPYDELFFRTTNKLQLLTDGPDVDLRSTATFTDTSSWHHVVVAVDTTQATSTDRVKIYMDGTQITAFDNNTYPAQNRDFATNTASTIHYLGAQDNGDLPGSFLLAEVNFIDGLQLDPSSFATAGVPIQYAGSFGTNGYYLAFESSGDLGNDTSGNNNDWTPNGNISAADQSSDHP